MEEKKKSYTIKDSRGTDKDTSPEKEERITSQSSKNTGAEKEEKLANEPSKEAGEEKSKKPSDRASFPSVDFPSLIMSLASASLISLGRFPEPQTGQTNKDLDLAQQNIDIIAMLEEKTRGNLNPQEKNLIENVLYELRIEFVKAAKEENK